MTLPYTSVLYVLICWRKESNFIKVQTDRQITYNKIDWDTPSTITLLKQKLFWFGVSLIYYTGQQVIHCFDPVFSPEHSVRNKKGNTLTERKTDNKMITLIFGCRCGTYSGFLSGEWGSFLEFPIFLRHPLFGLLFSSLDSPVLGLRVD